jgi:hypothetical protein
MGLNFAYGSEFRESFAVYRLPVLNYTKKKNWSHVTCFVHSEVNSSTALVFFLNIVTKITKAKTSTFFRQSRELLFNDDRITTLYCLWGGVVSSPKTSSTSKPMAMRSTTLFSTSHFF